MQDEGENGAVDLADKLKEFENPLGDDGDGGFADVLSGIEVAEKGDTSKEEASGGEDPPKEEKLAEEQPEEEEEQPEEEKEKPVEDDWDPLAEGADKDAEPEEESEEEPGEMPKTAKDWKAFHEAKAELRRQYKEEVKAKQALEQQIEKLKEETATMAELREKAELFDEAQKELAVARVEGTEEYKRTVDAPLKAIEDQVMAIAKASDADANKLFDAIVEADPTNRRKLLKEATEDMDSVDQADVFQMARDAQELLARRSEIRAKAQEAAKEAKEMSAAQEAAAQKKAKEEFAKATDHVVGELRKRIPFDPLKDDETEDTVYEALASRVKGTDFSDLTPDRKAYAVAAGVAVPRLVQQLSKAKEQITKLESRLSRKNASRPKVGGSGKESAGDDFGGDLEAAVDEFLGMEQSQDITAKLKGLV